MSKIYFGIELPEKWKDSVYFKSIQILKIEYHSQIPTLKSVITYKLDGSRIEEPAKYDTTSKNLTIKSNVVLTNVDLDFDPSFRRTWMFEYEDQALIQKLFLLKQVKTELLDDLLKKQEYIENIFPSVLDTMYEKIINKSPSLII